MEPNVNNIQQEKFLAAVPKSLGLLRFVICGSVDDGKSTLIGRLLFDAGLVYDDQLIALAADSKKHGGSETYDFSLLVDGLAAEREQKITLDIAYRYFSTPHRAFIVTDAPGHVQYTHNMVTAASTADVALVLVDVSKGLMIQTRRHTMIAALMGIKHLILVINKMDLIDYQQAPYELLVKEYCEYANSVGIESIKAVPVSALHGDNITQHYECMPWYQGRTLLDYLEWFDIDTSNVEQSFRMCVQWVNRPNADFRGFAGRIDAGQITVGESIQILPGETEACIEEILTFDGSLNSAHAGQSVTLTFKDPVEASRGSVLSSISDPCSLADQLEVDLIWMGKKAMTVGRQYGMRIGTAYVLCTLAKPNYIVDIATLEQLQSHELQYNQIGNGSVMVDRLIAFEPYTKNRNLGGFIITDKVSNEVVGAGVIRKGKRRSTTIPCQLVTVNQAMRSAMKSQNPLVIWFTGLSGAGKSTIANLLEKELHAQGFHTQLLDANNMRHGLNKDLGFSEADRIENTRRISEVAKLLCDAGLITIVASIAPFAEERAVAKQLLGAEQFIEIFVDVPLEVAESRDKRGLYAKARSGELVHFTGITSPYEAPINPSIRLDTSTLTPDQAVSTVLAWLNLNKKMRL